MGYYGAKVGGVDLDMVFVFFTVIDAMRFFQHRETQSGCVECQAETDA